MAKPRVDFDTTQDQFEGIHKSLDRVRSTSKTVTVDRQALANLLIDHGKLLAILKAEG
jgi:hypothetical protein